MKKLYSFATSAGTFYICIAAQVYFSMLESNLLDSASTPERAARELAASRHLSLPEGISFDELGIPADLQKWRKL